MPSERASQEQQNDANFISIAPSSQELHSALPPPQSELRLSHQSLNLTWMADRSSVFLEQGGSRDSLRDAWAQCLAGLLEPQLLPKLCPSAVLIAWPYSLQRMNRAYAVLDPG